MLFCSMGGVDNNISITFIIQFVNETKPDNDFDELRNALKSKYPNLKYNIVNIPLEIL